MRDDALELGGPEEVMIFVRAEGFYPIQGVRGVDLRQQAQDHAAINPGTLWVEDRNGNVIWGGRLDGPMRFLLWVGSTPDGAMADAGTPDIADYCETMVGMGLMTKGEPIEHIQVFHTTSAGLAVIGKVVQ